MTFRLATLTSAFALCLGMPAHADDVADDQATHLDRIQVTATRREEAALEVPVGVTVVGSDEIARRAPQTAVDLLHGETGTYVQQSTPGQGVVIVRGLKGSEILHLVDGFRLNNAFFRNAPNQYIALVDPLNLDRIEVARGPMSILYGSDAMGGVVQFLTPEPRFQGNAWQTRGVLRTRLGSADDSNHSRLSVQAGHARLGLSAGVSYQNVGDLRVGGGERLPYTGYSQRGGDFKALVMPGEGHELMFSAQMSRQPKTQRYDALVPGFGQTRADNAEFLFKPQERRFGQVRYRYTAPLAFADRIELQLGQQQVVDDRTTRETGTANRETEANTSTLSGFTAQAGRSLGNHYLTYGAEYYEDSVDSARQRLNINTGVVSMRPSRYPNGSTMESTAIYFADDWLVNDALDLNFGARYSRFDIALPPTSNGIGVSLKPEDVSGHVSVAYKLSAGLRLVGNAGRGFRAPNIFDLGTFGSRAGGRFNTPNAALKPEHVNTFDLGLKFADSAWQWEAMAFHSDYRDKITSVLTGERTDTGLAIVQSRNATRLSLWGVETGLRYSPDAALDVYATATYTRGDEAFGNDAYPADRVPPLFGKLGARLAVSDAWEVEGWSHYAGKQDRLSPRDAADPRINPQGTAGWATLNARVGWRATEALTVQLSLENIADKRYREHGSGLDEPGRNASLSVDWRF